MMRDIKVQQPLEENKVVQSTRLKTITQILLQHNIPAVLITMIIKYCIVYWAELCDSEMEIIQDSCDFSGIFFGPSDIKFDSYYPGHLYLIPNPNRIQCKRVLILPSDQKPSLEGEHNDQYTIYLCNEKEKGLTAYWIVDGLLKAHEFDRSYQESLLNIMQKGDEFHKDDQYFDCITSACGYTSIISTRMRLEKGQSSTVRFNDSELLNVDFTLARLDNYDFSNANLMGINLSWAHIYGAVFTGANLRDANFTGAYLNDHTLFDHSDLRNADLSNLGKSWLFKTIPYVNLSYADLREAKLSYELLEHAALIGANLSGLDLRGLSARDKELHYIKLCGTKLCSAVLSSSELLNADLRNADLRNADLRNAGLRNADLRNADLRNTDLRNADLRNASLNYTNFSGAKLNGAKLNGAKLNGAKLIGVNLHRVNLAVVSNFQGACLARAKLSLEYFPQIKHLEEIQWTEKQDDEKEEKTSSTVSLVNKLISGLISYLKSESSSLSLFSHAGTTGKKTAKKLFIELVEIQNITGPNMQLFLKTGRALGESGSSVSSGQEDSLKHLLQSILKSNGVSSSLKEPEPEPVPCKTM